jgi:hypothetical protein
MLDGAALGIQVLAGQGHSTYVAARIIGSVPRHLVATILSLIPGCQLDAWMSDYAMPERAVAPEEQIWSNLMDPKAAAQLLDEPSGTLSATVTGLGINLFGVRSSRPSSSLVVVRCSGQAL